VYLIFSLLASGPVQTTVSFGGIPWHVNQTRQRAHSPAQTQRRKCGARRRAAGRAGAGPALGTYASEHARWRELPHRRGAAPARPVRAQRWQPAARGHRRQPRGHIPETAATHPEAARRPPGPQQTRTAKEY